LLVDVGLPGMSGVELQQKLVVAGVDLPVILISGHAGEDMPAGAQVAMASVLEKPIDSRRLIEHIKHALNGRVAPRARVDDESMAGR
jgi:two-component system response regulator FixJ